MLFFKLSLLLVLGSVLHVRSQEERKHVELYEDVNYGGGLLWSGTPPNSINCRLLYGKVSNQASSLKTNTCIVLFSTDRCQADNQNPSFVLTPGEYPDLSNVSHHHGQTANKMIRALRECGEYEGDQNTAITFYNLYEDEWLEYYGIKGCYNLPSFDDVYGIDSGNCFRLHTLPDCEGEFITLQGGYSSAHRLLGTIDFGGKAKSISTC